MELKGVYIYTRELNDKKVCVLTNMLENTTKVNLPFEIKNVLLTNYKKESYSSQLELSPFETIVFEI